MKDFKKYMFYVAMILVFIVLTSCSTTNSIEETKMVQSTTTVLQTETGEKPLVSTANPQAETGEKPSFTVGDFEGYMNYISNVESLEPYYQTVFAFENVPGGIADVPIKKINAMYREMEDTFDYILINEHFLTYRGDYNQGIYKGNTDFVDGYEDYKNAQGSRNMSNPINYTELDSDGNEFTATSLKAVQLGEGVFTRFDKDIREGRNLKLSDFTLKAPNDPISVVLGNGYKNLYKIGDVFSLDFAEVMKFQVVGFYKPNVSFLMGVGAQHKVCFDYSIVMPHLTFDYKQTGKASSFQQGFLTGEKMSGYISIKEPIKEINDDIYKKYIDKLDELAKKNGVEGLYKTPFWPVGFVW